MTRVVLSTLACAVLTVPLLGADDPPESPKNIITRLHKNMDRASEE
jgi:hypothetical protein